MKLDEELKIYMQTICFLDESTDDYLYLYDLINNRLYFTDKIRKKYSLLSGENGVTLDQWEQIVYLRDREGLHRNLCDIRNGLCEAHNMKYRLVDKEGNKIWHSARGQVQKDKSGRPVFLMGSVSEMGTGHMADSLTGLWNSEKFMEDMGNCLRKNSGYLMLVGIDNFKSINVKNGRTFGNHLLKTIADTLEENSDSTVKIYRMDGDRFAVNLVQKTRGEIVDFYSVLKKSLNQYCTVSAGVVSYHVSSGEDSGIVYQYAENALDRAKREGKNKMIFFSSKDYQKSLDRIELQDELKASVENRCRGFYLCYQPQIDSRDFSLYGAEALLRYDSDTRGKLSPAEFIPLLEQSGLICPVGNWVLKQALEQAIQWRKIIPDFHISVNISYVQLRQPGITEMVLDTLRETGVPGKALTLEVTESMQLQDYGYFNKIFYEWKSYGIKIAIDDFGTGYSSLSYLKSIDIDETKIDRCFVNRIHYNAYNYRLLSNMIELAHGARIRVCCEGVETEEELLALQQLNPDVLQGFLFAQPYKKEEFERVYIFEECREYQERIRKEKTFRQMDSDGNKTFLEELRRDEIVNIVEGMDEVIYVSDVENYNLYYMNPAGRKLTGIYDYKGRKCYQVLQGRDQPCEFCTNEWLNGDSSHIWKIDNPYFKKHFVLKDKLIPWLGKMARLEIAIDVDMQWETLGGNKSREYISYDDSANLLPDKILHRLLNKTDLGLWVIRIDEQNNRYEMYTDDVMNRIMGLKKPLSPEECYKYWYGRINDGYYHYVNLAIDTLIQSGDVKQLEYTWNHPEKGEITVQCTGIRVKDNGDIIQVEGYHTVVSDLERLSFLPDDSNREIFEFNEKKQAVYFHTDRKAISGEEKRERNFPEVWIQKEIVHPDYAEKFRDIFREVQNKKNIQAEEMLLRTKNGNYKKFNLQTRRLSNRIQDAYTIVVRLDPVENSSGN